MQMSQLFGKGANAQLLNALAGNSIPFAWGPVFWHRTRVRLGDLTGSSPYSVDLQAFNTEGNPFPSNCRRMAGAIVNIVVGWGGSSDIDVGDTGDPDGLAAGVALTSALFAYSVAAENQDHYTEGGYLPLAVITAASPNRNAELEILIPFSPLPSM